MLKFSCNCVIASSNEFMLQVNVLATLSVVLSVVVKRSKLPRLIFRLFCFPGWDFSNVRIQWILVEFASNFCVRLPMFMSVLVLSWTHIHVHEYVPLHVCLHASVQMHVCLSGVQQVKPGRRSCWPARPIGLARKDQPTRPTSPPKTVAATLPSFTLSASICCVPFWWVLVKGVPFEWSRLLCCLLKMNS